MQIKNDVKDLEYDSRVYSPHEWHWGAPRTGKSHYARTNFPDAYIKSNNIWWDGYNGQAVVIMDEVSPNCISASHIKQWADKWTFQASIKGS